MPYDLVPRPRGEAAGGLSDRSGRAEVVSYAALIAITYFVVAQFGLLLVSRPENVATIWPASGIAVGAQVVLGRKACLPVATAVMAATVAANIIARGDIAAASAFAACNAFECLFVFWLLDRLDRTQPRLESLGSVLAFLFSAGAATAVAAIPAAVALKQIGLSPSPLVDLWRTWFEADALGIVVFAPVIIAGATMLRDPPRLATVLEGSAGIALLGLGTAYAFELLPNPEDWPHVTPPVVIFPILLWIACRTPVVFSAGGALVCSLIILIAAIEGTGRFSDGLMTTAEKIESAQLSVLATCLCALSLASVFARYRNIAAALVKSEQRMDLALSAAGIYAFDYDLVRGAVFRIGGLAEVLDLPTSGRVDDFVSLIHPDDQAPFVALLRGVSRARPQFHLTLRLRKNDGAYLVAQHRAEGVIDAQGRLVRIIGSCIDITRAQEAEHALAAIEERLKKVMEAGRIFTHDRDATGSRVVRSDNAAEIMGLPPEDNNVPMHSILKYVEPDDRKKLAVARKLLTPQNPTHIVSIRFNRPDHKQIWLELLERVNFDENGQLLGHSGLSRDITARMSAEEKQTRLIEELNHRVKNSLARVSGVIKLSREGHDALDGYARALEGRIASMARTHQRLASSDWEGVDLETLVKDELEPYRTQDNIALDGLTIVLVPDIAQAMSMTLHELATNAAKYGGLSTTDGRVSVSWRIDGNECGRAGSLMLVWKERTTSSIDPPAKESFGTDTIRSLLRYEYQARVDLDFEADGVRCTIVLPLDLNRIVNPLKGVGETSGAEST